LGEDRGILGGDLGIDRGILLGNLIKEVVWWGGLNNRNDFSP
jgi:hypothetical protein